MKFQEALGLLDVGSKVVRRSWTEVDGYLTLMPGIRYVWKIITTPQPNAGNHIFSVEEMQADDWELLGWNRSVHNPDEEQDVTPSAAECAAVNATDTVPMAETVAA